MKVGLEPLRVVITYNLKFTGYDVLLENNVKLKMMQFERHTLILLQYTVELLNMLYVSSNDTISLSGACGSINYPGPKP